MAESCAALGRAVISQVHFLTSSAELAREEAGKKKCGQGVLDAPQGVIGASCMANTLHSAQKYPLNGGSFCICEPCKLCNLHFTRNLCRIHIKLDNAWNTIYCNYNQNTAVHIENPGVIHLTLCGYIMLYEPPKKQFARQDICLLRNYL